MAINLNQPDRRMIARLVAEYEAASRRLRQLIIAPPGTAPETQQWNRQRAMAIQAQVDAEITRLKKSAAAWTGNALTDSAKRGVASADRQTVGIVFQPEIKRSFDVLDRGAVELLARDTVGDLTQAAEAMGRQTKTALQHMAATGVSNEEVNQILTGAVIEGKPKEAMRQLKESLRKVHGDKVTIPTRGGGEMVFNTGDYARMVANTKTSEALNKSRNARLADAGIDLVRIVGRRTSNPCTAYLDKVFSLSGKHPTYPPLSSLQRGGPPFHPNCSKSTAAFIEDLANSAELEVAQPDPETNRLLKEDNWNVLRKRYERSSLPGQVFSRTFKLRNEAGDKNLLEMAVTATQQEDVLRNRFKVAQVELNGHAEVGAHVVRGLQRVISAGGSPPKLIVVDEKLFADSKGVVDSDWMGQYNGLSGQIALNPRWEGWRDPKVMKGLFRNKWLSSDDTNHVALHEFAHDQIIKEGIYYNQKPFDSTPEKKVATKVSRYAVTNKDEFLAEAYTAMVAGRRLSPDELALYKQLGGV